ncbi:MAG: hypothetical protein R3F61_36340 [Myxococcota bacterium]
MALWVLLVSSVFAVEPCPEGRVRVWDTQPECCLPTETWSGTACVAPEAGGTEPEAVATAPKPAPRVVPKVEKRLVLFSGYGGQTLWLDGEEVGRLPLSREVAVGEHAWVVRSLSAESLAEGTFKARKGTDNQLVMLAPSTPKEPEVEDIRD